VKVRTWVVEPLVVEAVFSRLPTSYQYVVVTLASLVPDGSVSW